MLIPPELIFKVYNTFISKHSPTGGTCRLLKTGNGICEGCPVLLDTDQCGFSDKDNKDYSTSFEAFYNRYPELLI